MSNTQVLLKARPAPDVTADLFKLNDGEIPTPGIGELLIRVIYLSLDPAMRGWIAEAANYQDPVPLGGVMTGFTVGEVIKSNHSEYKAGDIVQGRQGWQEYAISDGSDIDRKVDPALAPISTSLGPIGMNGATAYVGLVDKCAPKAGETILVTTAAGAVGSMVGQIGKILGCRTVGITGSDDKVRACTEEFGYDAAINYKSTEDLSAAIVAACPDGIDCFFDSVGGDQFDAVIEHINVGARIAICGTIGMPSFPIPNGPRVNRHMLVKRARMEGFLILDHYDRFDQIIAQLSAWYRDGKLNYLEDVSDGLAEAPGALVRLLQGHNTGKQIIRVGTDPT